VTEKEANDVTSQPENNQLPADRTSFVDGEVDHDRDNNGTYPAASLVPEAELDADEDGADPPLSRYEADGDEATPDVQDADEDLPSIASARSADGDDHPDTVVVEAIDPDRRPDLASPDDGGVASATDPDLMTGLDLGSPGSQWHDIQAMFVDDPQGSVRRAAEAADAAVAALTELLRQRLGAPAPAVGSGSPGAHGETEALREQLLSYRVFCESLADLGQQLPEPAVAAG
jgi:hypothetical protein